MKNKPLMIDFKKIFKQKLTDYKVYSSKEENNSLWDSISDELDNLSSQSLNPETISTTSRKKRRAFVFCLFLASLVAMISSYLMVSAQPSVEKEGAKSEMDTTPSLKLADFNEDSILAESSTVEEIESTSSENNQSVQKSEIIATTKDGVSQLVQVDEIKQVHLNSNRRNNNIGNSRSELIQHEAPKFPNDSNILLDCKDNATNLFLQVNGLLMLPPSTFVSDLEHFLHVTNEVLSERQNIFHVRVCTGPTWSHFNYRASDVEGSSMQAYNQNFQTDWSWGSGVLFEFDKLNQTWGVGIEANQFVHRLEYQDAFVVPMLMPNQLVFLEVNAITGDTLQTAYGPLEVSVNAERNVIHHNRLRTISIPLEWQKSWEISRWTLGVGSGLILQWRASVSGRSFSNQEGSIPEYTHADFTSSQFQIRPGARIFSSYHLSPTWSIDLSTRFYFQDYSSESWKGRLWMGNVQLGLKHELRW